MGRFSGKTCRMSTMIVLTAAFFLLEVVFGYITNSMALIADSFHMLSDVLALIIGFVCMKFSKRRRSARNTFGWVRAEVLGALVNTVFLIALSFSIVLESIQRLFEYQYIRDPVNVLIVGGAGLAVNIIGLVLFHGHGGHTHSHGVATIEKAYDDNEVNNGSSESCSDQSEDHICSDPRKNEQHSNSAPISAKKSTHKDSAGQQMNMHGVWLHVLGDAFGSIVVIVNAIVNWKADVEFLRRYLDPMLSLVLSGIIIATSIPLFKESALILLQTVPPHINVIEIERKLLSHFGNRIAAVHEFHVWRLTGNKIVATAHILCRGGLDSYTQLAEKLKEFFHDEGIHSTTIQLELAEYDNISIDQCTLKCPKKISTGERVCSNDACCFTPPTPSVEVISSPRSIPMIFNAGGSGLFPISSGEILGSPKISDGNITSRHV